MAPDTAAASEPHQIDSFNSSAFTTYAGKYGQRTSAPRDYARNGVTIAST